MPYGSSTYDSGDDYGLAGVFELKYPVSYCGVGYAYVNMGSVLGDLTGVSFIFRDIDGDEWPTTVVQNGDYFIVTVVGDIKMPWGNAALEVYDNGTLLYMFSWRVVEPTTPARVAEVELPIWNVFETLVRAT